VGHDTEGDGDGFVLVVGTGIGAVPLGALDAVDVGTAFGVVFGTLSLGAGAGAALGASLGSVRRDSPPHATPSSTMTQPKPLRDHPRFTMRTP
jgi:hypothetical protein